MAEVLDVGGGWNFRVFVKKVALRDGTFEDEYYIGEAYYDSAGTTKGWTANAIPARGESLESVAWDLARMQEALSKPVIRADDPEELERTASLTPTDDAV